MNNNNEMILGFRANINEDSHRIYLNRLINQGVSFKGIPSYKESGHYSFIFDTEKDFRIAQKIKRSMAEKYSDLP